MYCTAYGNRGAVTAFTDAKGWYPGLEFRRAKPVLPRHRRLCRHPVDGNQLYSTRIVDPNGNPLTALYGIEVSPAVTSARVRQPR